MSWIIWPKSCTFYIFHWIRRFLKKYKIWFNYIHILWFIIRKLDIGRWDSINKVLKLLSICQNRHPMILSKKIFLQYYYTMFDAAGSRKTKNVTSIQIFFDFVIFCRGLKTLFNHLLTNIKRFSSIFLVCKKISCKLFYHFLEWFQILSIIKRFSKDLGICLSISLLVTLNYLIFSVFIMAQTFLLSTSHFFSLGLESVALKYLINMTILFFLVSSVSWWQIIIPTRLSLTPIAEINRNAIKWKRLSISDG